MYASRYIKRRFSERLSTNLVLPFVINKRKHRSPSFHKEHRVDKLPQPQHNLHSGMWERVFWGQYHSQQFSKLRPNQSLKLTELAVDDFAARCRTDLALLIGTSARTDTLRRRSPPQLSSGPLGRSPDHHYL